METEIMLLAVAKLPKMPYVDRIRCFSEFRISSIFGSSEQYIRHAAPHPPNRPRKVYIPASDSACSGHIQTCVV